MILGGTPKLDPEHSEELFLLSPVERDKRACKLGRSERNGRKQLSLGWDNGAEIYTGVKTK